ncbi:uncharacterized protein N0V89_007219 [Didymosphaeria variabile]|uniref:Peptidase S8/S53 domain-containing protein n=1 Tax=Didymosphaeria variabile TaxID=1932322 RepID=A0A9W8XL28_9PLEO|nr:uncharacterized protein N0V89_007219 [Didymosphaeria variabile]KAJ4351875.1 hypothetical protein N0V89_007219 [Didymosphaeria variabile]
MRTASSAIPHDFVLGTAPHLVHQFTPYYYFENEQQSVRFQCAARQKQLLQTFETHRIKTHDDEISHGQQLKVWQKPGELTISITFFVHKGEVEPKQHYELELKWFKQDIKRSGDKGLIMTFYTRKDERRGSSDNAGIIRNMFQRRPSENRRISIHSRSSSNSSNHRALPDGNRMVTPHKAFSDWRSLLVEFEREIDVEQFLAVCHDPGRAPEPRVPESHWKVSHGFEETVHFLKPVSGSFKAGQWFTGLHSLRKRYFPHGLDDAVRVNIAVLDTGIDNTNPDITEMWGKRAPPTRRYRNFLNDASVAGQLGIEPWTKSKVDELVGQLRQRHRDLPQDDTGHGTHVAGIIMQLYPEANLFIGRVIEENVVREEEATRAAARRLALAILFSAEVWKVKIISLSIGFRKAFLRDDEKAIVRNALKYVMDTHPGVIVFAAASNEGNRDRILFPASEDRVFCVNSSNGDGKASEFNPPHQERHENFSILGEGVSSTCLQHNNTGTGGRLIASWAVRSGTSVATPIAASVAAIILHFGRQWAPDNHKNLETRRGIKRVLESMAPLENRDGFYDIVPWMSGVFVENNDFRDPNESIATATERLRDVLD